MVGEHEVVVIDEMWTCLGAERYVNESWMSVVNETFATLHPEVVILMDVEVPHWLH